jgi:hypothetical protein
MGIVYNNARSEMANKKSSLNLLLRLLRWLKIGIIETLISQNKLYHDHFLLGHQVTLFAFTFVFLGLHVGNHEASQEERRME